MRKPVTSFVLAILILLFLYSAGCRRAGVWLAKRDVPPHADAIVVLMGSFPERVLQAYDSWKAGLAARIIIVEESMGPFSRLEERGVDIVSNSEQAASSLIELGVPADSILLLPGNARSTIDEALAVRKYLDSGCYADTLVLVSSPTHMRRATMIFSAALNKGNNSLYIGSVPSEYTGFNADKWWKRKEDIQSVVSEFIKIVSFRLFEKNKLR